jgi:hypothetical protein
MFAMCKDDACNQADASKLKWKFRVQIKVASEQQQRCKRASELGQLRSCLVRLQFEQLAAIAARN